MLSKYDSIKKNMYPKYIETCTQTIKKQNPIKISVISEKYKLTL